MFDDKVNRLRHVVNKAATKAAIMDAIKELRPGCVGKLTRVSSGVYDYLEANVITDIRELIRSHPSIGKTVTTGTKNHMES
jgi:hypothetical protein